MSGSRAPGSNAPCAPISTRALPLGLVAAGDPDGVAGRPAEHDQRRRHAAARALHEDAPARLHARHREQHPVRRQPRRRQAGRLLPRAGSAACRRGCARGTATCSASVPGCRSDSSVRARVERLVAVPAGSPTTACTTTSRPSSVDARRVAAQDHRQLVGGQAHALERPEVVVVERGGLDRHPHPAVGDVGLGPLAHPQPVERVVGRTPVTRSTASTRRPLAAGDAGLARAPAPRLPPRRAPPPGRTRSGSPAPRSASATQAAIADAAASFIASLTVDARTSSAPRNTPGNASTLLIWFGKSLRPVATTARDLRRATPGRPPASGLASANTIASAPSSAIASSGTVCGPDTPTKHVRPAQRAHHVAVHAAAVGVVAPAAAFTAPRSRRGRVQHALGSRPRRCRSTPASSRMRRHRRPGRARPADDDRRSPRSLPTTRSGVAQRRQHHDRRAVLVVVEHRDVEPFAAARPRSRSSAAPRCPRG